MEITIQQQLLSARFRHLMPNFMSLDVEPDEAIVDELLKVLQEIGGGNLEEAAEAIGEFNERITSDDPKCAGTAAAISSLFLEGHLDCTGIRDGQLVWVATDKGREGHR